MTLAHLIYAVALAYGVLLLLLFVLQRRLLYRPSLQRPDPAAAAAAGFRVVELRTADGVGLLAWHRPAREGHGTLILLHGNAGHIGDRVEKTDAVCPDGWGALLVSWRGYGGNPGWPSEAGLLEDARAALRWLEAGGVAAGQVAVYGESLGSGVAVQLAIEAPVAAVVLEAPYTSIAAVAQRQYPYVPAYWLVLDRFDSLSRIGRVRCPILILHGDADRLIPVTHGRRLAAAAPDGARLHIVAGAGHADLHRAAGGVVRRFLDEAGTRPATATS